MTALRLLTEPEAAEALRVCARTLRKARREGKLRYVLIGRAVRYSPDDLEAFVESSKQENTPCQVQPRRSSRTNRGQIIPFSARQQP